MDKARATKENILACARDEFLAYGFRGASMRRIASSAGLTTGAIYRYFADKDALFDAVTKPARDALTHSFASMSDNSYVSLEQGVTYSKEQSMTNLAALFDIIYNWFDEFYLLSVLAEGSGNSRFWDELVELEVSQTLIYAEKLKKQYNSSWVVDETTMHIISECYFNALLEPIRHRLDRESAICQMTVLGSFFADGWKGIEDRIRQS